VRDRLAKAYIAALGVFSVTVALWSAARPDLALLFSNPHGVPHLLSALQGSAPLTAVFPTFTDEDWLTAAFRLWLWIVAVVGATIVARVARRRASSSLAVLVGEASVAAGVICILAGPFSAPTRAESVDTGRLRLMRAFDPIRRRAFDYVRLAKLMPQEWQERATLVFDLNPSEPADERGRLTSALSLAPGQFRVTVWFQNQLPHPGELVIALQSEHVIARLPGPLRNPSTVTFSMPVAAPQVTVQLTDRVAAQAVTRVEVAPVSIVPASDRLDMKLQTLDEIPMRPGAYIAYVDDKAYPEGGVFWTRGTSRAQVFVVPAGGSKLALTVHAGLIAETVHLRINDTRRDLEMISGATMRLEFDVNPAALYIPLTVQASAAFRPSEVEPPSSDSRLLGCQVRIQIE
jgi:hypothetical protein